MKFPRGFEPLPRSFFAPSARAVAQQLLGHYLLRRTCEGLSGGPIVETEAYLAGDPACHSYGGETARNHAMFGPPGHAYVYLIYGYHYCVNAVCRPAGCAEAVLLRAIEAEFGEHLMRARRQVRKHEELTKGPAKLCEALAIDRKLDGVDLSDSASELFIAKNPGRADFLKRMGPVITAPRIGITKAAESPLRFFLKESPFVSRRHGRVPSS